ncbi:MAG TPA: tetratricopeptide repeat protein [Thermoleophilia bacterium]|nr:tetratricopeptide repeat protein [Thermoleophilia bacterium]HQG03187.1 tetratricopeptide repeat protein [Thermoleophilia bacterium]HQJ97000.1 tetratricopeptide repeat protein [Thermoleophilia bacterium]
MRREPGFDEHSEAYALFRRGMAFLDARHPGQAAQLLERALALEPDRMSIREALGRALFALGETSRAAAQFEAIVAAVPDNDYAQYALGRCLVKMGRAAEGRGRFRLAAALAPRRRLYGEALGGASDASPSDAV